MKLVTPTSVWYLAHPVAGDERFTYDQNLEHVLKIAFLCFEEGFRVYVPWYAMCLIMPDSNPEYRRIGLEVDCELARLTGLMIQTGHKLSSGMQQELDALNMEPETICINCIGANDQEIRDQLREFRKQVFQLGRYNG